MNSKLRNILEHMLEDATDAINFADEAGSIEVFSSSKMTYKAVVMSILNIGELTKHLPIALVLYSDCKNKEVIFMETPERDVAYELDGQLFVWDKIKAEINKAKHGISFEEAASVFVIGGA